MHLKVVEEATDGRAWVNNEEDTYYLYVDGVLRLFEDTKYTKEVYYASRECAQRALDKFNNKGNVAMDKKDLRTGMQVVMKNGRTAIVMLGHGYGDIAIFDGRSHIRISSLDFNPDSSSVYSVASVHKPVNQMGIVNTEAKRCIAPVWENKGEIVVMTIAELEKKLGIDNLQIKD